MSEVQTPQWLRVYAGHIRSIPENAFEGVEEIGRPGAAVHERRRVQFRAGRALARVAIERSAGISRIEQKFEQTQSGKPVCVGGPPISLTHSGDWVACAVAATGDVGIDLQFPAAHLNTDAIADSFFHDEERQWVLDGERERFFMLWTLKEAYLKALGVGLSGGLNCVSCRIDPPKIVATFNTYKPMRLWLHGYAGGFLSLAAPECSEPPVFSIVWNDNTSGERPLARSALIAST